MNENDENKMNEERERAEISFDILEREYEDLLEEIKINPDLEKIKAMRQRIEASESEMKNVNIIDVYEERLSAMKGNLLKHLKPLHRPPEVDQGEVEVTVTVEPFADETGVIAAPEASIALGAGASIVSEEGVSTASAPMEDEGQPILKKVENPGLRYVNEAIEAAETGLLDDAGQPRKDSFGNPLDKREQLSTDFVRGVNYTVGGKSSADLQESEEKDKKERVKQIVKDFLGMEENEPENSEKSKQYQFIINAGQDLISMFTDDVKHNIQYQGADLGPVGTPPFEMKWSMEGEEVILELQCEIRNLENKRELHEGDPSYQTEIGGFQEEQRIAALNQSGEVELYELESARNDSPPLVRYHYKARLVPTDNGAKLETINYSVELHPSLSHKHQLAFTEMQSVINTLGSADQMERLKNAIKVVKDNPLYNTVKNSNDDTREEKKAISMIDRLDKILQASERSKIPILASIVQKAVLSQVNRMKNSDEFNTAMVSLAKKAKPEGSAQFREDSMDTKRLEKEDLRMMKEFIERVERLQKGLKGTANVKLPAEEIAPAFNRLKDDSSKLSRQFKENKSDNIEMLTNWAQLENDLKVISSYVTKVSSKTDMPLSDPLEILANRGKGLCDTEKDKNILRKQIDLIKISPEYLEYQQAKRDGTENEHPRHETFSAVDECEKLLKKAMNTQKLPLVSDMNNNKLKKFFEENAGKFEQQVAPSDRASFSQRNSEI